MRKIALRVSVAAITFIVGVGVAWFWLFKSHLLSGLTKPQVSNVAVPANLSLPCAARKTDIPVRELLASGAYNVNETADDCIEGEPSPRGVTLLMWASAVGNKEDVKLLLGSGADIQLRDSDGDDALMYAAGRGDIEIITMLIERGADVNTHGDFGRTPLMNASGDGNLETVSFLLDRGADPNATDPRGSTALMYAAAYKCREVVKLLLSRGADPKLKDQRGRTFVVYARDGFPREYNFGHQ